MSWSVGESDYPATMTIAKMNEIEEERHYQNRGSMEPVFSKIEEIRHDIFADYDSARDFVMSHLKHGESKCVKYYAPKRGSEEKLKELREKIVQEAEKQRTYSARNSIKTQKAKLVTCKKCESRIAKDFIKTSTATFTYRHSYLPISNSYGVNIASYVEKCPVCGNILQSKTVQDALAKREGKIIGMKREYVRLLNKMPKEIRWFVYSQCYIG